ncbi:MAG TPA: hypothetical protein VFK22_00530 [Candidatus Dormibacteraeota bacterium]|nr:hypothetical protein [Candidatus Dormibacteraeota bacterium]
MGILGACVQKEGPQPVVPIDETGAGNMTVPLAVVFQSGAEVKWSYDCSSTGGRGVFAVDVFKSDKTPDFKHPGVNEEGDQDAGTFHLPGPARYYLEITTTCAWKLRVVEVP